MNEQEKNAIELEVRRLFSANEEKHREFLERNYRLLVGALTILVVASVGIGAYFIGNSLKETNASANALMKELKDDAKTQLSDLRGEMAKQASQEVIQKAVDLVVRDEIQKRIVAQIDLRLASDEITAATRKKVLDRVESEVQSEASKAFAKEFQKMLDRLPNENITNYLIPSGTIVAWFGTNMPRGWAVCDGNNGTPDLRGRFLRGVGNGESLGGVAGAEFHQHAIEIQTTPTRMEPYAASAHHVLRMPPMTGESALRTTSGGGSSVPPYVGVLFIIKL